MTSKLIPLILFSVAFTTKCFAESAPTIQTWNKLRFDIHETFLDAVQLTPEIKLLLTKGRGDERMAYLAHHDGRTQKFNVTSLQYTSTQLRSASDIVPQGLSTRLANQRILKGDFNSNGKIDVAYVSSVYEELIAEQMETRDTTRKIRWGGYECSNFDVLLSLDNMENNFLLHFDDGRELDIGGKHGILLEEHPPALRSTTPVKKEIWEMLKTRILSENTEFSCIPHYDDPFSNGDLQVIDTLNWKGVQHQGLHLALDWSKVNSEYNKALEYYRSKKSWPKWAFVSLADIFGAEEWFRFFEFDVPNSNQQYTNFLTDLGFFVGNSKDQKERRIAIPLLTYVLQRDSERTPAYLNLADVQYDEDVIEWQDIMRQAAAQNYREYHKRMVAAGKKDQIPARVFERMK